MSNNDINKKDLIYPLDDLVVEYQTKHKVNPFDIPTEFVESPIPLSSDKDRWARLPKESIPGLTDDILVSDHGKVYNNTKKIMINVYNNEQSYKRCKLPINNNRIDRGVHRLVLMAFDRMPDQDADYFVPNHVDGNPEHNSLNNLEWATHKYNNEHATMNSLTSNKLSVDDVKEICEMLESKEYTSKQIAEKFDCNDSNIRNIKSGVDWKPISKRYNIDSTPRLKEDKIRKICEMLESGKYTDTEIADINGVSRPYIHDIRSGRRRSDISKEYNIDRDNQNTTPDDIVRKICEMIVENKYSDNYIAKECGVGRTTVYNIASGKNRRDISKEYFSEYKVYEPKKTVTPEQIDKVKELLKTNKYSDNAISKMVGVSRWTVDRLKNN